MEGMKMTKGWREHRKRERDSERDESGSAEGWYYSVRGNDRFMFDNCVVRAATYCALRASCEAQRKRETERGRESRDKVRYLWLSIFYDGE